MAKMVLRVFGEKRSITKSLTAPEAPRALIFLTKSMVKVKATIPWHHESTDVLGIVVGLALLFTSPALRTTLR